MRDLCHISWYALKRWLQDGTQPSGYVFGYYWDHYFESINELPRDLLDYDWSQSHDRPMVFYYDEMLSVQILQIFHEYFREKNCNIQNIIMLTSCGIGVSDWWRKHVDLYQEKSFQIKEWLFVRSIRWQKYFSNLNVIDQKDLGKNISHFFNSYGGTNPKIDRQYLCLKLRGLDKIGLVDMISPFTTSRQQLINHAYYLGYFGNPDEEKSIGYLYDIYVHDGRLTVDPLVDHIDVPKVSDELFNCSGAQYQLDRVCLSTVINETNNQQPWGMTSEKTMRPFWHHCAVIHPGYRVTQNFERMGFWFPHDIFDYSYQNEADWLTRINLMIQSIQRSHAQLDNRYQQYWLDNYQAFKQNALLLQEHYHSDLL